MAPDKVTTVRMLLKVDLQCHRCYKKVKKILCKFPQIQDQIYDEKQNTVTIKVVCCCPEKIKEKIRCKGGDSIKRIEILPPPKPPPPADKPKPPPPADQPKPPPPADKPKPPPPADKPKPPPPADKPKPPPPADKPKPPPTDKPKDPVPVPVPVACPPPPGYPLGTCCRPCSEGYFGGPCFHGHGGPPPCYEGYGRPVYDSYGGGGYRSCYASRCDYFCEENASGCTIM